MWATDLPVKMSFDKNPLSFEKKVFNFSENSRTFVGSVALYHPQRGLDFACIFGFVFVFFPSYMLAIH